MKAHNIALVAHDARKADLIEWVKFNDTKLSYHNLICTGTTGKLVVDVFDDYIKEMEGNCEIPTITRLKSGPLGGDQQIGSMIAEGKIDFLFFLADNLSTQPHDVDVKALSRLAQLYNIPMACNRSTADFIISSPLFNNGYTKQEMNFDSYINREVCLIQKN